MPGKGTDKGRQLADRATGASPDQLQLRTTDSAPPGSVPVITAYNLNIVRIVGPNWCDQFERQHGYRVQDTVGYRPS